MGLFGHTEFVGHIKFIGHIRFAGLFLNQISFVTIIIRFLLKVAVEFSVLIMERLCHQTIHRTTQGTGSANQESELQMALECN